MEKSQREIILDTVQDLVSNFLYYDRKGDEELPIAAIDIAIDQEEITIEEIVEKFRQELIRQL